MWCSRAERFYYLTEDPRPTAPEEREAIRAERDVQRPGGFWQRRDAMIRRDDVPLRTQLYLLLAEYVIEVTHTLLQDHHSL